MTYLDPNPVPWSPVLANVPMLMHASPHFNKKPYATVLNQEPVQAQILSMA